MPNPTGTFNRPDLGTAFAQIDRASILKGYIATQVLPVFNSPLQSANYSVIKAEALMRLDDLTRAAGAGYNRSEYDFQQASFSTVEYGLEEAIDDRTRKLYMYSFDCERYAAERLGVRLATNLEVLTAAACQSGLGGTAAAAKVWSDVTSDPIADVRTAKIAFRALNGIDPSQASMVLEWEALEYLKDNPSIIDRIKYNGTEQVVKGKINAAAIADAFGIKEIIVAGGMKNTADRGQTRSLSQIWTKTIATLFHKSTGDIQAPGLGHTVVWSADGGAPEGLFEEYREEQTRSQIVRCRSEFAPHVKYTSAGYTITSIL